MKKVIKFVLGMIGLLAAGIAFYVFAYREDVAAFQKVLSGYHSHLFCSCHYVMKQSEEHCLDFARQYIDIQDFKHDRDNRSVFTKALGVEARARFVNAEEGCILDAP